MRNPTLQGLPGPAARHVEHQSWEKLFQRAPFLSIVFKGFWWLSNRKESAKATLLLPQDCPLPSLHTVFSSSLPEVLPPEPLFLGTGLSSSYFCARGSGSGSSMYAPRAHHKLFDRKMSPWQESKAVDLPTYRPYTHDQGRSSQPASPAPGGERCSVRASLSSAHFMNSAPATTS